LPFSFRWQDLKDVIRNEGFTVSHVEVLQEPSGRSKGCGIARFQSRDMADNAIKALDGLVVHGRNISCRLDRYSVKP
jgi:RNA recognition motif-containing protein